MKGLTLRLSIRPSTTDDRFTSQRLRQRSCDRTARFPRVLLPLLALGLALLDSTAAFAQGACDPEMNSDTDHPLYGTADPSTDEITVWDQTVSGTFEAYGWAIDASGVSSVTVEVGTTGAAGPVRAVSRPDVCAYFSNTHDPRCPMVGWQSTIDTTRLPNGAHWFKLSAVDENGNFLAIRGSFRSRRSARASRQRCGLTTPVISKRSAATSRSLDGRWTLLASTTYG